VGLLPPLTAQSRMTATLDLFSHKGFTIFQIFIKGYFASLNIIFKIALWVSWFTFLSDSHIGLQFSTFSGQVKVLWSNLCPLEIRQWNKCTTNDTTGNCFTIVQSDKSELGGIQIKQVLPLLLLTWIYENGCSWYRFPYFCTWLGIFFTIHSFLEVFYKNSNTCIK
jgi:hypothetical protein